MLEFQSYMVTMDKKTETSVSSLSPLEGAYAIYTTGLRIVTDHLHSGN